MAEMLVYEAGCRFSVQCNHELVLGHVIAIATYLCAHCRTCVTQHCQI